MSDKNTQFAEWIDVSKKNPPETPTQYLCAWKHTNIDRYSFEVLIHWPDGAWSNTSEDVVDEAELPDLYQEIIPPTTLALGKAPDVER